MSISPIRSPCSQRDRRLRPIREGRCENCGCDETGTSLWRTAQETVGDVGIGTMLCNACGLYVTEHKTHRPSRYWGKTRNSQSRSRSCSSPRSTVSYEDGNSGQAGKAQNADQKAIEAAATLLSMKSAESSIRSLKTTSTSCRGRKRNLSEALWRINPAWLRRRFAIVVPPPGFLEPAPAPTSSIPRRHPSARLKRMKHPATRLGRAVAPYSTARPTAKTLNAAISKLEADICLRNDAVE